VLESIASFCLPGPVVLGPRIAVIGSSCAGKTTLAKTLADNLNISYIELDALQWGPNWTPTPTSELRSMVHRLVSAEEWVCDGNYSKLRDIIWQRVDTFVWLDYQLSVVLWRWYKRTIRRVVTQERLWNNNQETIKEAIFSRDALFWWILKRFHNRRREYQKLMKSAEYQHVTRIYLPDPRVTQRFCAVIRQA
jgi:adenylate kinase family enzyme